MAQLLKVGFLLLNPFAAASAGIAGSGVDNLLLEDGGALLLESGATDALLLEG